MVVLTIKGSFMKCVPWHLTVFTEEETLICNNEYMMSEDVTIQ